MCWSSFGGGHFSFSDRFTSKGEGKEGGLLVSKGPFCGGPYPKTNTTESLQRKNAREGKTFLVAPQSLLLQLHYLVAHYVITFSF